MQVLNEYFETRKEYDAKEVSVWSADICEEIRSKLKELGFERYKFVVQVRSYAQQPGTVDEKHIQLVSHLYIGGDIAKQIICIMKIYLYRGN